MNNVDRCYRAELFILENKVAANVIKKFSVSLEPAGFLQCSGEPFNLFRLGPHQSNISTGIFLAICCHVTSVFPSCLFSSEIFVRHCSIVLRDGWRAFLAVRAVLFLVLVQPSLQYRPYKSKFSTLC